MRKCAEFSQAVHAVTRQRRRQSSALRIVPKASHGLAGTESKPGVPGAPDSDGLALFGEERRAERELGQRLRLAVRDVLVIHASVPATVALAVRPRRSSSLQRARRPCRWIGADEAPLHEPWYAAGVPLMQHGTARAVQHGTGTRC